MTFTIAKETIPVCPCPWCEVTPSFVMMINNDTWTPHVACVNPKCSVQPKSKYISIRRAQRFDMDIIYVKIKTAMKNWNHNNPKKATVGFEFAWQEIVNISKSYHKK